MTDQLMAEMRAEVGRFVHDLIVQGRPLRAFLWGPRSWVGPELAAFYGMDFEADAFSPQAPARWTEHGSPDRRGILGRAALLASTAFQSAPALSSAAPFVLERILGMPPPPPPPGVSEFDEDIEERERLTERGKLELHRQRPDCAACHARIDPLGFALDGFDRFGRERAADTSGVLPGGTTFEDLGELKDLLLEHHGADMAKEASRRLLAYALGRQLTWSDERSIGELAGVLQADGWRAWVLAVVASRPFRYLDPAAAPQGNDSR